VGSIWPVGGLGWPIYGEVAGSRGGEVTGEAYGAG
jgi:hypothetical protein